ncbi:MAG: polyprenyl diphosphate synthase [Candidatus Saccharibacteria bacterium]|nr:polyprenyl diphosphate synthase [Candidatus Saccharibacteria bacterium]
MSESKSLETPPLNHLGFIVDGNRRWARQCGLPDFQGHTKGLETLESIVRTGFDLGIQFISLFIFSTDNWRRSRLEVNHLMRLFLKYFKTDSQRLLKEGIKFKIAGQLGEPISEKIQKAARSLEESSKNNTGPTLVLCFNYGGHTELVDMVKKIIQQKISPEQINLEIIRQSLYHPDVPDLDLIIRTSGEQRLSGFQLWRASYSELLFINKYWPDFTSEDLKQALAEYSQRHRRFGG